MLARMEGVALVVVLFILTMMTVLIAWLSDDMMLSIRRTENIRDAEQAYQMAIGSEQWGVATLNRDGTETQSDHLNERWNHLGAGVSVEQGELETTIQDQQGLFNINNLQPEAVEVGAGQPVTESAWFAAFKRLLLVLELDEGMADAIVDWIDADENVRGSEGAEDSDYLVLEPPYRAANRMLTDVSELLWIKGFNQEAFAKLAPYVTALPATGTAININTAPRPILRILGQTILSAGEADLLLAGQTSGTGYTVDQFLQHDMMAGEQETASALIDDKSSFFLIKSAATYGKARLVLRSLVRRRDGRTDVIQRQRTY